MLRFLRSLLPTRPTRSDRRRAAGSRPTLSIERLESRDTPVLASFAAAAAPEPPIDTADRTVARDELLVPAWNAQLANGLHDAAWSQAGQVNYRYRAWDEQPSSLRQWAGGAEIDTLAIVFTDVLGSTQLANQLGNEAWSEIRQAHFSRGRALVERYDGYLIKTIGDSIMAVFHSAPAAIDFALDLAADTDHDSVRVRVGVHVGLVQIDENDVYGQAVNMAARVEAKATDGGIWVSQRAKEDIEAQKADRHAHLQWAEHQDQQLRGFDSPFTLWSL